MTEIDILSATKFRNEDTVTITISRKDAEVIATQWGHDDDDGSEFVDVILACRAALEGEK